MNTLPLAAPKPSENILLSNLHLLIQEHKISEARLARETGIPQPTLHKILSGKTTDPRISTLQTLASYFEITLDSLFSDNVLQKNKKLTEGKSIPIISWADCLKSSNPTQSLTPNNWSEWVVVDDSYSENTYALPGRACMEPRLPKGTVLIIDTQEKPTDGDLVIVQYPDTQQATIRELSIDGPNQLLLSINQTTEPDKLDESIRIIGTVMQSRFTY